MTKVRTALAVFGVVLALGTTACSGPDQSGDGLPLIASGTVRKTVPGKPARLVPRATVTLTWTGDRSDAKAGDKLTPEVVARTTTGRDGRYTLRAEPSKALVAAVRSNDVASFTILVEDANGDFVAQPLGRQVASGAWAATNVRSELSPTTKVDITYRYDANGTLTNGGTQ
jgi:hypothetical protein